MFCSGCGTRLEESYRFCFSCGRPTHPDRMSPWGVPKSLTRPLWEKKISGVCAGFARYFDVDVSIMRIIWLVLAIFTGVGFIAYIVAWIAMPAERQLVMPVARKNGPQQDSNTGASALQQDNPGPDPYAQHA